MLAWSVTPGIKRCWTHHDLAARELSVMQQLGNLQNVPIT